MRYERHLFLDNFDASHQKLLSESSVLVAGAGGLGSALLLYLAAAGVGHIGIVDFDVISESNLNRQVLYSYNAIGCLKTQKAAERIKELNPDCRLTVNNIKLTKDSAKDALSGFNIVVDATDNYPARYAIDGACRELGVPFVYGSAEGWGGQLSVFHYKGAGGYSDLYPEMPKASAKPPGVLGPMPGFIGTRQALEVIKIITGIGEVLSGKLMIFDILSNNNMLLNIGK